MPNLEGEEAEAGLAFKAAAALKTVLGRLIRSEESGVHVSFWERIAGKSAHTKELINEAQEKAAFRAMTPEEQAAHTAGREAEARELEAAKQRELDYQAAQERLKRARDPNAPPPNRNTGASASHGAAEGVQAGGHAAAGGNAAGAAESTVGAAAARVAGKAESFFDRAVDAIEHPFRTMWRNKGKIIGLGAAGAAYEGVKHTNEIGATVLGGEALNDFAHGRTRDGLEHAAEAGTLVVLKSMLGKFMPEWMAAIFAMIAAFFIPSLAKGLEGQGAGQTHPAATPAADTSPVVAHTGPALALDAAGQADIKTLQASMRANKAVSGYQGAADGQLTPDTIMGMQKTLAHDGKYNGPVDGKLSSGLMDALNNSNNKVGGVALSLGTFSELSNLTQNPSAAPATPVAPVAPTVAAPSVPAQAPAAATTLSTNADIAQVQEMQAILRTTTDQAGKPYYNGRISGAFDAQTQQAIAAFRNDHPETKADGATLGPATAAALTDAFKKGYPATDQDIYGPNANVRGAIVDMTNRELSRDANGGQPSLSPTAYTPGQGATPTLQPAVLTTTPHAQPGLVADALAAAAGIKNTIIPSASAEELPPGMRPHPEPATPAAPASGKLQFVDWDHPAKTATPAVLAAAVAAAPHVTGNEPPHPVAVPTAPPAPPTTRIAANDNPPPHSDKPAQVAATPANENHHSGFRGWMDALSIAAAGATFIPVVGNVVGTIGQGLATLGTTGADVAEGRFGAAARDFAIGAVLTGVNVVPEGGVARLAVTAGIEEGGTAMKLIGGTTRLAGKAIAVSPIAVPAVAFAGGLAGVGDGGHEGSSPAAPMNTPKVANSNFMAPQAMGYGF